MPLRAVLGSKRHPNLVVLDKANGGKADALNAGINMVQTQLLCTVDADSLLEGDALLRAVRPFVEDPKRIVGVGGTVRVANGCIVKSGRVREIRLPRRLLPLLQTIEYLRAFMMARLAWGHVGALMVVSGTFGLFCRDVVVEVGGYSRGTVGEDMEVIVKIHRHMRDRKRDYEIAYVPEPVCWTQVPETLHGLARQRIRWQRGAIESFVWHRKMLMRPRYGIVGTLGLGHILLADIVAPLVELLSYVLFPLFWAAGLIYWEFFAAWLALTFGFGVFISVGSLVLEELELKRRAPRRRPPAPRRRRRRRELRLPPDQQLLAHGRPLALPAPREGLGRHAPARLHARCLKGLRASYRMGPEPRSYVASGWRGGRPTGGKARAGTAGARVCRSCRHASSLASSDSRTARLWARYSSACTCFSFVGPSAAAGVSVARIRGTVRKASDRSMAETRCGARRSVRAVWKRDGVVGPAGKGFAPKDAKRIHGLWHAACGTLPSAPGLGGTTT